MTCAECNHWHLLSDGLLTLGLCDVGHVVTTDLTECRYAAPKEE